MSYGYLIPTDGGKPLALTKRRLYLGRRQTRQKKKVDLPADQHLCEMLFLNDYWQVRALGDSVVFVNGRPTIVRRLEDHDEVTFGSGSYKLQYAARAGVSDVAARLVPQNNAVHSS